MGFCVEIATCHHNEYAFGDYDPLFKWGPIYFNDIESAEKYVSKQIYDYLYDEFDYVRDNEDIYKPKKYDLKHMLILRDKYLYCERGFHNIYYKIDYTISETCGDIDFS
jgi:hypothetical protein